MRHLIEHEYSDPKEWFNYYYQRDKTVLMTASENRRCDNKSNPVQLAEGTDYIKINDLDLFPDGNYCWRHGQKEINWLREQAALYLPR